MIHILEWWHSCCLPGASGKGLTRGKYEFVAFKICDVIRRRINYSEEGAAIGHLHHSFPCLLHVTEYDVTSAAWDRANGKPLPLLKLFQTNTCLEWTCFKYVTGMLWRFRSFYSPLCITHEMNVTDFFPVSIHIYLPESCFKVHQLYVCGVLFCVFVVVFGVGFCFVFLFFFLNTFKMMLE